MPEIHTPQDKASDNDYYRRLIAKQPKPVYTAPIHPHFELEEGHWLKPYLNKWQDLK